MGPVGHALAAGNAVVLKPSELTPGVGVLLAATFADAVPDQPHLLQTGTGPGSTGEALVRAGAAVPALPFGGSGASGHGRVHGAEGLRGFTAPQALTVRRFRPPVDLTSFSTPGRRVDRAVAAGRWLHSRR
ncbi:aldehyde dehydrogenase family protein [Streptomyces lunalinharesii]|uniref:Aldehyde dehydrogenase domain-containing protein n=1 Tax=Streptomyces lunalinharesii TaxID=333384 RepID=A0ABN3R8E8_9ACTN